MCDCGCNTCETKSTLMLNESLAPRDILSEGLKHHLDANKPLTEHLYRAGSDNYFNLWAEARSLYSRNILEITHEDDLAVLTETDLGHFGVLEDGTRVPLDFPIELTEEEIDTEYYIIQSLRTGSPKYIANIEGEKPLWVPDSRIKQAYKFTTLEDAKNYLSKFSPEITTSWHIYKRPYDLNPKDIGLGRDFKTLDEAKKYKKGDKLKIKLPNGKEFDVVFDGYLKQDGVAFGKFKDEYGEFETKPFSLDTIINEVTRYSGFNKNPEDPDSVPFNPTGAVAEFREELRALFGKFKGDLKNPEFIKGVAQIMVNWKALLRSQLDEKKKAKKNTKKLNKPMRDSSGGKAYKVYVKDPKTGNIKTVRFGSGGLRAKINDKKARQAFAKRHKCSTRNDKTKASYWSCRLPRYAKLLGLKSNFGGFW